ncbi:MAG: CPBP family intramembrane metalloprotease [Acidobacteria bacterium]|nr:CPBP family intramembrane metalloprotease [Acidobacteriota bacterium]
MNWTTIRALVLLEMRSLLRDRRTVIMSIVLPVLAMPIFLFASSAIEKRRQQQIELETMRVAVEPSAPQWIAGIFDAALEGQQGVPADAGAATPAAPSVALQAAATSDPASDLRNGSIGAYVGLADPEHADGIAIGDSDAVPQPPLAEGEKRVRQDEAPAVAVYFRSNDTRSRLAAKSLEEALRVERDRSREAAISSKGPAIRLRDVAPAEAVSVAEGSAAAGSNVGRFITALVIFMMLAGGGAVASDTIAGEKERGTLETLLTTSAARTDIVAAKVSSVVIVTAFIVVVQLASIVVYASLRILDLPPEIATLATAGTVFSLVLLYIPVAALASAMLLLVSGKARSYKESQQYYFPLMLVGAGLGLAAVLPGLTARSAISLVPVAGIAVSVRDVLSGRPDWLMIGVAMLSTLAAAALALRRVVALLSSEGAVSSATDESTTARTGRALFERRVWRWFAVMWAVLLVVSSYFGTAEVRVQVAINLIGIFLTSTLLMLKLYGLDPREALSLRAPHPLAWLAVLIGAPSGLLVAVGVSKLASYVLPVPAELIENFGKNLFPQEVPIWQMLVFVAILPGICEELAFRGALLYGLRRRMGTLKLCLTVGVAFGLFHFALFRLASTAFLGAVLSAVTVFSGSIFPAMVWHGLNNGLAVVAAYGGSESGGEPPQWISAVAVVPLTLSLWILYRWRASRPGTA